jgi:hypothetical protein
MTSGPALAGLLFLSFALAAEQDTPLEKFESKEGRYSVLFPGKPARTTNKAGGIDLHVAVVKVVMGSFAVTHSVLPPEVIQVAKPKDLLDGGQKGFIDHFKAKVTSSRDFEFGTEKYPARELVGEKDKLNLRIQIILAGNRQYQVFVVGTKEQIASKEANAFFESFEIEK